MSKNHMTYKNRDLFESGKAYQKSFGQGDSSTPNTNYPYSSYSQNGAIGGQYNNTPGENLPVPAEQPAPKNPSSFLGNLPIKDIKGFVDRMGGIDGIMSMATKVNSMFKTFQQMAPMFKLLAGSFMKAKTTSSSKRRRRKRKRSRRSSYNHEYSKGNGKSKGKGKGKIKGKNKRYYKSNPRKRR